MIKVIGENDEGVVDFAEEKAKRKLLLPAAAMDPPQDTNWLWALPVDSIFLTRMKPMAQHPRPHMLEEYVIVRKTERNGVKAVKLLSFPENRPTYYWTDSDRFTSIVDYIDTLGSFQIENSEDDDG